ncbi:uncharacterized protein BX664DRAFT_337611 [Halteromyces radiatus]|uniref:uncharacterized protein n=1 Tax=Halteromyces radiatus TaxID=101107 RepID=UPI00221E44EB|nr:uncharacterized protein BX664DRAFT_337611 [Halteromyces radiatus]KAI8084716.1 hypothetical protein BX664DRAFT_337611 [Halteromyces radiatus]
MSKLPKPPFESNSTRKRNVQPSASKSTTSSIFSTTEQNDDPRIGDRVLVEGRQLYGTLRFLGPTEFKTGTWAGIELDNIGTGKNDGSVQGIYYFTCAPNTGIFVLSSKIVLVSRNSHNINKKNYRIKSSSSSPISPSSAPILPSHSSTLRKQHINIKNSQRTVFGSTVTPSFSLEEYEHVGQDYQQQQLQMQSTSSSRILQNQQKEQQHDVDDKNRLLMEQKQKEIIDYQVNLGREQHRVYELRKEREHLLQQIQQKDQQLYQQNEITQKWHQAQDQIKQLEEDNHQKNTTIERLVHELEQTRQSQQQETSKLLEQQSQLIQELQRERFQHDNVKSNMKHVEQACQSLMDPFDVRPGLSLVDQLLETQRQMKDILEKVRQDTDQKQKQQREINTLHRDVANLESLIETKLFKEADLMETLELERQYNQQLQDELKQVKQLRRRKGGKTGKMNTSKKHHALSDSSMTLGSIDPRWTIGSNETMTTYSSSLSDDDDLPSYCEICETVGHDLMSCLHVVMNDSADKIKFSVTSHMVS